MIPHGTKILARILTLRSELLNPILINGTDLVTLGVEIELGVTGRLGCCLATAHCPCCYGEEALERVCGVVRMTTAI